MKKFAIICLALACASVGALAGCGSEEKTPGNTGGKGKIEYETYESSTVAFTDNATAGAYNTDLWYRNDLTRDMGDPMVVYEDGYFYAYGTRGGLGFNCYRSDDLTNWTDLGVVFSGAQAVGSRETSLWAPDLQKIGDTWYLYYTVNINYPAGNTEPSYCQIGVAQGNSPAGPFTQVFDPSISEQTLANTPFKEMKGSTILDQNVFEDDNGKLYMYFSYDCSKNPYLPEHYENNAEIWGVELKSPTEWDISTLTRLIRPGYKKVDDAIPLIKWENWSPSFANDFECAEGPYMVKHGGKYILTYCANSFVDLEYAVGYAVGDTPFGPFEKPNDSYLQNMLLGVPGEGGTYVSNRYKGFMTGTGHASVVEVEGELMFAYHAHMAREWNADVEHGNWRALAFDYLYFDAQGMPYTNGPTWSLTRLPAAVSGYTNLASLATVRADGENVAYLNDNFTNRAIKTQEVARETTFKAGRRSIELTFASPVRIKAVVVYNSYDYDLRTRQIAQIDFGEHRGIVGANFNPAYLKADDEFIYPHSAYNVELQSDIITDRVVITFESAVDFAVGEVEIIGRTMQ